MLGISFGQKESLHVLCLGAHCDDIEIGAGGTLLKLFDKYKIEAVKWVVFASNEIREQEARASAQQFTARADQASIEVYSYRDGFLPFLAADVKEKFEALKKDFNPDIIFTHYRKDRHQDHRLVSDLTWNTWRNHLILEYEIPKYDGDLGIPNFYVDLEKAYIEKKNGILMQTYASQRNKHWFDDDTFKALPRLRGMESATVYAEAFYARKLVL